MIKHKKKKLNIKKLITFIMIVVFIIILIIFLISKLHSKEPKKVLMTNVTNSLLSTVKEQLTKYKLDIEIEYKYDDNILKDYIISQSIPENTEIKAYDKLSLVVSKGKLDKEKLKNDGINELGKVPIMMYHGIKNMKDSETNYTGGNVDKDGYTRTVESFRKDLEFYYQEGYRMVKLSDCVSGNIDTPYGYSPIVLTFDDGNDNNILVTGLDSNGNIIIDPNSAVGVLEEYKKKYPDFNVTAIFFVTNRLFNQPEYDEKILNWLVSHGYEVGNHTKGHDDLKTLTPSGVEESIGYMYNKLNTIIGDKYTKIVALPFGSPYVKSHANYEHILTGEYNGIKYETISALRVGWEPEVSPFDKEFDKTFLKRCRAYDNKGKDFDIEMVFKTLSTRRYISDGDAKTIITSKNNENIINKNIEKELILYE